MKVQGHWNLAQLKLSLNDRLNINLYLSIFSDDYLHFQSIRLGVCIRWLVPSDPHTRNGSPSAADSWPSPPGWQLTVPPPVPQDPVWGPPCGPTAGDFGWPWVFGEALAWLHMAGGRGCFLWHLWPNRYTHRRIFILIDVFLGLKSKLSNLRWRSNLVNND